MDVEQTENIIALFRKKPQCAICYSFPVAELKSCDGRDVQNVTDVTLSYSSYRSDLLGHLTYIYYYGNVFKL